MSFTSACRHLWKQTLEMVQPFFRAEDRGQIGAFDRSSLFFLLVTAVWYAVSYASNESMPGPDHPGWWAWYDQQEYRKSTLAMVAGRLDPSPYWFGYPLLGVPFASLLPLHPYLIPNTILVLVMVGSFFNSCRQFMGRAEAWVLIFLFIFFEPVLRDGCLVLPWNTLPAYATLYLSLYLLNFNRGTLPRFALCAAFIGLALFSRPTELLPMVGVYLFGLFGLDGRPRRLLALSFLAVAGLAAAGLTVAINLHVYHHLSSPYVQSESGKLGFSNYGLKLYQFLCDGGFLTGNAALPDGTPTPQLLERFPLLVFLFPSVIYLVRTRGLSVCGLPAALVLTIGFYLTYVCVNDPPYVWTYGTYHYYWWIIPWLVLLTYLSFRQAPFSLSRKTYLAALLIPLSLFLFIGFRAVNVASTDSPLAPIGMTSTQGELASTLELVSPGNFSPLVIQLTFAVPPAYQGTNSTTPGKVKVAVNGTVKIPPIDYLVSQHGKIWSFSFLGTHALHLKRGDIFRVEFPDTPPVVITRAIFLDAAFFPCDGFRRLESEF